MGYYIDLSKISLSEFKKRLKNADLLPSQKILEEDLDGHFKILKDLKIKHMADLQLQLKSKKDVDEFAQKSGLSIDYLTILRREVNSYHPKPNNLKDFPGILKKIISTLEKKGIKHTGHIFEFIKDKNSRKKFSQENNINADDLLELTKLTDLSRIKWVGPLFARMLLDAGFDSAKKVSEADYKGLYEKLMKMNEGNKYYKGKFGVNDMKLCVTVAKDVPDEIEF